MALQAGDLLAGRYRVERLLGEGGMGAVYAARDESADARPVAIKIVKPEYATSEVTLARFARESRVATRLAHPHIVSVFDAGTDGGTPFMIMEYLEGSTLGDRLRECDRLDVKETLEVARGILEGLVYAHAEGVVHRDLKPDNVFLVGPKDAPIQASSVKLLDFGISKIVATQDGTRPIALTKKDSVVGTPYYIAPEQARALPDVDGRADLFSLGAILFECLTGRPPFIGKSFEVIIALICTKDVPPLGSLDLGVPESVSLWIERALKRERAERFDSAQTMLVGLPFVPGPGEVHPHVDSAAHWPGNVEAAGRSGRKSGVLLPAAVAFAVGVILVVLYVVFASR